MKDQKDVVEKVIDYIERNLEKELNLDNISKNIGYSKFYLNRIFTAHTGITIYKYLQNRRLTVAAEKPVKTVIEQTSRGERSYDIFSRLLSDRIVFLEMKSVILPPV